MDQANPVRDTEQLNWEKLETCLKDALPDLTGKMEVAQFHGGHANLTYLLKFGDQERVLRRPPFGKIAPGAHSMKREYRVLSQLYQHFSPAPRAYLLCEDVEIIGAPFIIMERCHGVVIRKKLPPEFVGLPKVEERVADAMIRAQANLHTIKISGELEKLGRPNGFLNRQLEGWGQRWDLSKTSENKNMDWIRDALAQNIPTPQTASIIHNDHKLDNCQFQPDNPDEVTAIFDWDMATLGDPLADFGATLSYWPDPATAKYEYLPVMLIGDYPPKEFLKERYQQYTGFSLDSIVWYESFSFWKLAIIAQQLYKRYVDGATKDPRMAHFGKIAEVMAERGKMGLG